MSDRPSHPTARAYVGWLRRHAGAIVLAHLALLGIAVYLIIYRLPLFADFSYLLPQDAPAVKDLHRLEARLKATDTVLVVIRAPTSELRAQAATELAGGIRKLPRDLVSSVVDDDSELRGFLRAHRHLFVPLPDLERARDALRERLHDAKLEANPLYVDLDDDAATKAAASKHELEQLRSKRRDAERVLDRSGYVDRTGTIAIIEVQIAFSPTDMQRGHRLIEELQAIRDRVVATHPGVTVGLAGGNITAVAEHAAISKGIVLSSLITGLLVTLLLVMFFRSATLLAMLVGTIGIATAAAFGAASLTVGHLNAATAFLGAIIAGNGVNYGILLIARYLEERRTREVDDAIAIAIATTLRPTAVASLGASIAYGSLAATSFKGFADFAIIGALGIQVCWIASFVLLPALIVRWGRDTRIYRGEPFIGRVLDKVIGFRKPRVVVTVITVLSLVAGVVVFRFIAADPFEYDMKKLRSEGEDAITARNWMKLADENFGRGHAGPTFIAADRPEQVPQIVKALRAADPDHEVIGKIMSMAALIPDHQREKLAVLAQIRNMLDDDALADLDDHERAELAELRPPNNLGVITPDDLPKQLRDALTEKDGRVGLLIGLNIADQLDDWNGHDLMRFASIVRKIDLPDGATVTTSGTSVIFADIIETIRDDGPFVTLIAAIGLGLMVLLLVGFNRCALAVGLATGVGTLGMIAACAVLDIKVTFLDFVALPITLGLGIDYAINIAHRHHGESIVVPLSLNSSAVFVCSLTTIIGYGSLLLSDNLAIRGFGSASLIGEITCVLSALVIVPAVLAHRSAPATDPATLVYPDPR